jgi:hypothetical protein
MRYYPRFPRAIPHQKVDNPRVTHQYATVLRDCSPFSFDLHVLGAPPALILSRDQTLVENDRVLKIAPACTQNSDEFVSTTSNQIVKDLRSRKPPSARYSRAAEPTAGLETCFSPHRDSLRGMPAQLKKFQKLKRAKQEGRIRSEQYSPGVLLPFLTEDLNLIVSPQVAFCNRI